MTTEPTIQDVLDAVQALASHVDVRFERTDQQLSETRHDLKDFVDRRVADAETRLEAKIGTLVDVLEEKEVITSRDAHRVAAA